MCNDLHFAAFEEEGENDLVEALGDVDGDVVDAVLQGALLQVGLLAQHLAAVGFGDFGGLQTQLAAGLEVDELMGPRVVVEL